MLPKAAISVSLEVYVKPKKLETPNCKHSVSEETENSKVQTLSFGAKVSKNSQGGGGGGGLPICPGGAIASTIIATIDDVFLKFLIVDRNMKFVILVYSKLKTLILFPMKILFTFTSKLYYNLNRLNTDLDNIKNSKLVRFIFYVCINTGVSSCKQYFCD